MDELKALHSEIAGLTRTIYSVQTLCEGLSSRLGVIEGWMPQVERALLAIQGHIREETGETLSPMPTGSHDTVVVDFHKTLTVALLSLLVGAAIGYGAYLIARGGTP